MKAIDLALDVAPHPQAVVTDAARKRWRDVNATGSYADLLASLFISQERARHLFDRAGGEKVGTLSYLSDGSVGGFFSFVPLFGLMRTLVSRFHTLNPFVKGAIGVCILALMIWGSKLEEKQRVADRLRDGARVTWTDSGNAEDRIKELLRDPDSADFSQWMVGRDGYTCGTVNAKNGFGGMSGRKMFAVRGREVVFESSEPDDDKLAEIARICL